MKDCVICRKINSTYKCPTCKEPYCSLDCCKAHKSVGCEPINKVVENSPTPIQKYEFPTVDTVAMDKLVLLRDSKDIKECLKNPHVRDIVKAILNDSDPTKALALAMIEPIFQELSDACLKVVEPPDEKNST